MSYVLYVLIGFLSGIISGMGIGGGTILIPALTIFFDVKQQTAQNINLIYFIPTACIALFTHKKNGNIETKIIGKLVLFGLLAAVAGSLIAVNMDPSFLKKLFGGFLLIMGLIEIFKKNN